MRRLLLAAALVFATSLPIARAQAPAEPARPAFDSAPFEAIGRKAAEEGGIPGLQLAVARKGGAEWAGCFGKADVENGVAVSPKTLFRTASVAKPMTAVIVMRLVEQGVLGLDDDVRKWVPEFPGKKWPVTIRQLLAHQGGIRHYRRPDEARGTRHYRDLVSTIGIFGGDELVSEPGNAHHYSTYGYTLLGLAAERAGKADFERLLFEQVLEPAGMRQTVIDDERAILPFRARGYERFDPERHADLSASLRDRLERGALINCALHDTSMKIPGGGLRSTAADLVRFGMALLEDRLVSRETRDLMWTPYRMKSGEPSRYGLGFAVAPPAGGRAPQVSHSGGQAGAACLLVIDPEGNSCRAIMTNLEGAPLGPIAKSLGAEIERIP